MNKTVFSFLVFVTLISSSIANASTYTAVEISEIQAADITGNCTNFRLKGNASWFAVSTTHNGHDVIISILLATQMAGKKINVYTTESTVCGGIEVSTIRTIDQ